MYKNCLKKSLVRYVVSLLLPSFIILVILSNISFANIPVPQIHTTRIITEPTIDGNLEALWNQSQRVNSFIQVQPDEDGKPTYQTYIYSLYTDEALYFAIVCQDEHPDSITRRLQRRDNLSRCDHIYLNLDTFNDKRTGYYFGLSSSGIQADGTINNELSLDASWDGVWESDVSINDTSWTAEIKIPFSSIRHSGREHQTWGMNVTRYIYRKSEWDSWSPYKRQFGNRASKYGTLHGLHKIKLSSHLEFLPHVVGRWDAPGYEEEDDDGNEVQAGSWHSENKWDNFGIDLKFVPSSDLTLDMTFYPDFAQVDIDQEVINLSDYPVYIAEKRPFFLEGKQIFDSFPVKLLYTRRITDPDLGSRATFQQGKVRGSFLGARNWDDDGDAQGAFAGRMIYNAGRKSTVGFATTHLFEEGFYSTVLGFDTRIRWNEINHFDLSLVGVDRTGNDSQPIEVRTGLTLDFDPLEVNLGWGLRGTDCNYNDLGWSNYSNQQWSGIWTYWRFFPENSPIELWQINMSGYQESLPDGRFPFGNGNISYNVTFINRWSSSGGMSWGTNWRRDYADEDEGETGEFRDNFGEFDFIHYDNFNKWFGFSSDQRRKIEFNGNYSRGTHREGRRTNINHGIVVKPANALFVSFNHNFSRVNDAIDVNDKRQTDFHIYILSMRWTPVLGITTRATIQRRFNDNWDDGIYDASNKLQANLLLAWNWLPNSWFYLVYDETQQDRLLYHEYSGDRTVRTKLTWFFDKTI